MIRLPVFEATQFGVKNELYWSPSSSDSGIFQRSNAGMNSNISMANTSWHPWSHLEP